MPVAGGHTWAMVETDDDHTCDVTTDGDAYCWGYGLNGQRGDGDFGTLYAYEPVPVLGGHTFAAVSVGEELTCGVTPAGAAWCWGENTYGQLGDGTNNPAAEPVAVVGGHVFAALYVGPGHTCAVTPIGEAYCWGFGRNGRLGDGQGADSWVPARVSNP